MIKRVRRWLRTCFPLPVPILGGQWPAWLLDWAWRLQATAEPRAAGLPSLPVELPYLQPGSYAPGDPADALYDGALAWDDAIRATARGDRRAMPEYLAAGWLADPWWIRAAA